MPGATMAEPRQATEIETEIDEIGARGDGIATQDGTRIYVPNTLPGERHRVALGPPGRHGIPGQSLERLSSSPDRITPPCPHYDDCGGCSLQHWSPTAYGDWKRGRVVDALTRVGLPDAPVAGFYHSRVFPSG